MRVRIAVLLGISVVAISAVAFAQGKDPGGSPFDAILQALGVIGKQTAAIEGQVSDQATGLPAVQNTLLKLDAAVAGVDARLGKLGDTVINLADTIREVEETVKRPPMSAHKLWVSPYWTDQEVGGGSEAHIISPAITTVLNPGEEPAHVSCLYFEAAGSLLVERSDGFVIDRGATRDCNSFGEGFEIGHGWIIVHSDRPVLPYGYYFNGRNYEHTVRVNMQFYPVDCDNPEGVEFVCNLFGGAGE